jgi:phosphate uptake regulator
MKTLAQNAGHVGRLLETHCVAAHNRIRSSFDALHHPERAQSNGVHKLDAHFTPESEQLDRECLQALATAEAPPSDLRLLAAVLRASASLGRLTRLARRAAEDARTVLFPASDDEIHQELDDVGELVEAMVTTSIVAFEQLAASTAELVLLEECAVIERIEDFVVAAEQAGVDSPRTAAARSLADHWCEMLEESNNICQAVLFAEGVDQPQPRC